MASFLCVYNQPTKDEGRCVGSSYGWLIIDDPETETNNLYLFNPSSSFEMLLPSFKKSFIQKAILSHDPSKTREYLIVVIYDFDSKISLLKMGGDTTYGSQEWRDLDRNHVVDIIYTNGYLYALDDVYNVGIWRVNTCFPKKIKDIKASLPIQVSGLWNLTRDRCYLVNFGCGDLLLVRRAVGDYVLNGKPILEEELLDGPNNHPFVCPYMTLGFEVYKLNSAKNEWEAITSIGADRALFLGGNQSVYVSTREFPECEGNSIYFTDDYWDRMDEDYLYGGHDLGLYNMEEKKVKKVCEFGLEMMKIEPPPFWVVPASGYDAANKMIW